MATQVTNTATSVGLIATVSGSSAVGIVPSAYINKPSLSSLTWVSGVAQVLGLNQAGFVSGTIAASSSTHINMYTLGGYTDAAGNAMTLACIKYLMLINLGATSGTGAESDTLVIGNYASTAWVGVLNSTGTITLPGYVGTGSAAGSPYPSFALLCATGAAAFACPSSGNLNLQLANGGSANTIGYQIWALGSTS